MSQPDRDLASLFARMRAEDPAERAPEDEAALEARIAARVDHIVAREPIAERSHVEALRVAPTHARSASRSRASRVVMWLAAAAIPFVVYAASRTRSRDPAAQIGREPAVVASAPPSSPEPSQQAPAPIFRADPTPDPKPAPLPARATPIPSASPSPSSSGFVGIKPSAASDDAVVPGSGSTLSAENRLFEEGTRAERDGNTAGAIAALDRLVRDFPRSPLAQNAMVRRFHLLARAGRNDEAVDAARAYLAAYPQGFGQREAEAIIRGVTPSDAPAPERK